MMKKLSYFTYESLPLYTMVTSMVLEGNVLQFYLVNPTFARSELNSLMAFNKYSRAKFILQLRFSTEMECSDDTLKIKRWANFGLSYDELSQFLYPDLLPDAEFAIQYKKKQLFAQMLENHLKLIFIENADIDDRYTYLISLDQFNFLRKSIEKSLPHVTGWLHPQQFVKEMEIQKSIN